MNRVRMDVGGEGMKMLKIFVGWAKVTWWMETPFTEMEETKRKGYKTNLGIKVFQMDMSMWQWYNIHFQTIWWRRRQMRWLERKAESRTGLFRGLLGSRIKNRTTAKGKKPAKRWHEPSRERGNDQGAKRVSDEEPDGIIGKYRSLPLHCGCWGQLRKIKAPQKSKMCNSTKWLGISPVANLL